MRIFAVSDLHIDYDENRQWFSRLSLTDYKYDILILAGDLTDLLEDIEWLFWELTRRFLHVLYVPGNHDLWIRRTDCETSLDKFMLIKQLALNSGVQMSPLNLDKLSIIPLYGWYDYSFGLPSSDLYVKWVDFSACQWPDDCREKEIAEYFLNLNKENLQIKNQFIISFSHFLPRADLIPDFVPLLVKSLLPVMGTAMLDEQLRILHSNIHIYGHSHLNRRVVIDKTLYINNAFGYPYETHIAARDLLCVFDI